MMRKIRVNTFISLDGIMQAPGGPNEDTSGGFLFGGWSVNYWDHVMMDFMKEFSKTETELLLGRKTYDIFVSHWPHVKNDPAADQINNATKYVVSESMNHSDWKNTIILNDNPLQKIQQLKEKQGPDLLVHGSSQLIQSLLKSNLIDEMTIWTFPLLLKQGKKLFTENINAQGLELVQNTVSTTGVIISSYSLNKDIKLGSFSLDKATD